MRAWFTRPSPTLDTGAWMVTDALATSPLAIGERPEGLEKSGLDGIRTRGLYVANVTIYP